MKEKNEGRRGKMYHIAEPRWHNEKDTFERNEAISQLIGYVWFPENTKERKKM